MAIVGGGVMGAMLGVVIKLLQPEWRLAVFERLNAPGRESSAAWHNAGTSHSALCEPNYTPVENGRMETAQAVRINEQFQVTRQLLASLVRLAKCAIRAGSSTRCPRWASAWVTTISAFSGNVKKRWYRTPCGKGWRSRPIAAGSPNGLRH